MSEYPPGYVEFRDYLTSAIELELAALTRRAAPVSVAERERLAEAAFPKLQKGAQRAADSIARTAAQQALGRSWAADSFVEDVFCSEVAAAMRKYAQAKAQLLLKEANSTEKRTVPEVRTVVEPKGGEPVDVRALVKSEVVTFCQSMHRGVWKEGERYEKGQMVTRQGSTWSILRDNPTGRPGDSRDYLMVVKAGRDAK